MCRGSFLVSCILVGMCIPLVADTTFTFYFVDACVRVATCAQLTSTSIHKGGLRHLVRCRPPVPDPSPTQSPLPEGTAGRCRGPLSALCRAVVVFLSASSSSSTCAYLTDTPHATGPDLHLVIEYK